MDDPCVPTKERQRLVPEALARLETLADRLNTSVEGLRTCFSPVLFSDDGACSTGVGEPDDESSISGSDLGQSLRRVADRIKKSVSAIDVIIDAADV